jgi:hypothetical protein
VGPLVVKDGTLLVSLVMIDAENTAGESAQGNQATCFGWEIPCPRMAQGQVCLESVQINGAHARRHAIQLGVVPGDRKRDRRVEQDAEIVRIVRVLPEVVSIDDQPAPDSLL